MRYLLTYLLRNTCDLVRKTVIRIPSSPLTQGPRRWLRAPAAQSSAARCCSAARTREARISASTWGLRRRGDSGALVTGDAAEGGE